MISSKNVSDSWSEEWTPELDPTKSEHNLIGNFHHSVIYTIPFHNPNSTQTIPKMAVLKKHGHCLKQQKIMSSTPPSLWESDLSETIFRAPHPSISPLLQNYYPAKPRVFYSTVPSHYISQHRGIEKYV